MLPVLQKYLGVTVHILEFKSNPIEFWSTDRLGQMLSIVALNREKINGKQVQVSCIPEFG